MEESHLNTHCIPIYVCIDVTLVLQEPPVINYIKLKCNIREDHSFLPSPPQVIRK